MPCQDKASGSSKGCGIVEYEHPGDALRALARLSNTVRLQQECPCFTHVHDDLISMFGFSQQLKGREIHVREDREELAQAPAGFDMYGGAPFDPGYSGSSHGFHSRGRAGGHYMGDRPSGYGDRGMRTMMPGRRQPPAAAPGCQVSVDGGSAVLSARVSKIKADRTTHHMIRCTHGIVYAM